jgi:DNA polymerase/3'-5' exonuclease PolX
MKTLGEGIAEASYVVSKLGPVIKKYEICGSIRRKQDFVQDIDIVIIPDDLFMLSCTCTNLHAEELERTHNYEKMKIGKNTIVFSHNGFKIEIYMALDEQEFEVLKLVRTGNWKFNKDMCTRAFMENLALRFADGLYGLYGIVKNWDKERQEFNIIINPLRLVAKTEEEIITRLYGSYVAPEEREI